MHVLIKINAILAMTLKPLWLRFAGTRKDNAPAATFNLLKKSSEVNGLSKDVHKLLWKNKMRFTKADAIVKSLGLAPNWKVKKLVDKEEDEVGLDGSHAADEYNCKKVVDDSVDCSEYVILQRLNWRPPSYYGRDDLETLMASDSTADWIRISEMLLGKVPDAFT
ncbi:hypothetical protein Goshw_019567 [Gossypium schwendimanii]|uniref:Uncharacterized protein n=1 Tax=Gossypium schwendimanii TaxID=34291 RepID=A0A7J9MNN3_GOSSC|nr:hypothetical protein [Gossypium schwendimanii]